MEYMGLVVFPRMKAVFDAHGGSSRPFRCQTCHGEDMERARFRMPHSLLALPSARALEVAREKDPEMARFMAEEVVPAFAAALGSGDPGVRDRVSCATCHPGAEAPPSPPSPAEAPAPDQNQTVAAPRK